MHIVIFLIANFSIFLVLNVSMRLLGLDAWLAQQGMGEYFSALLLSSVVLGFMGSFISLAMSKWLAKRSMGVRVITEPANEEERWLIGVVRRQANDAGIGMPEVGIFPSSALNAFATGMNKNKALVAVSRGLLQGMKQAEIEAVLGHEVSHVANGDMVTMGLLQGLLNTFVIFLSRMLGMVVDKLIFKNQRGRGPGYWIATMIAELVLGLLATMIAMWFSRRREFRADAGGAALAGRMNMIAALRALQAAHKPAVMPEQLAAFGINGGFSHGFRRLFLSHPPLAERIAALEKFADQ